MTLVERFIEINGWSTSRKTVLLAAIGAPAYVFNGLVVHFALARQFDVALIDKGTMGGTLGMVICFIASWFAMRAGKEGRWVAYLLVVFHAAFFVYLNYLFGSWSSPYFVLALSGIILVALYYDARLAWFGLFYFVILLVVIRTLEVNGVLPYAPGLLDRGVDAQQTNGWLIGVVTPAMSTFLICFVISLLIVAATRLQDSRLREAHQKLERSDRLIRRYVPSQIADAILSGNEETAARHERRKLTVFFSDLVGFTEIAEELEPEDLSRVLNEYFTEMTGIAQKHGGTVDELSGDAILIFFGAPVATNDKDHALRAVRMATEMQQAMDGLNAKWRAAGITEALRVRMGINTGVVTVGNFGSPERMKYAALGKHVNLAARLQAQCEPGKVLLSPATWLLVNDQIPCMQHGEMQLKGIPKPVMTYELTS